MVRVTNLATHKSDIVRINDRCSASENRIIDLSYITAQKIGLINSGMGRVKLEILGFNGKIAPSTFSSIKHKPIQACVGDHCKASFAIVNNIQEQKRVVEPFKPQFTKKTSIQVGAFRRYRGAEIYAKRYSLLSNKYKTVIKNEFKGNSPIYRVRIEGFANEREARNFMTRYSLNSAFLVRR